MIADRLLIAQVAISIVVVVIVIVTVVVVAVAIKDRVGSIGRAETKLSIRKTGSHSTANSHFSNNKTTTTIIIISA